MNTTSDQKNRNTLVIFVKTPDIQAKLQYCGDGRDRTVPYLTKENKNSVDIEKYNFNLNVLNDQKCLLCRIINDITVDDLIFQWIIISCLCRQVHHYNVPTGKD